MVFFPTAPWVMWAMTVLHLSRMFALLLLTCDRILVMFFTNNLGFIFVVCFVNTKPTHVRIWFSSIHHLFIYLFIYLLFIWNMWLLCNKFHVEHQMFLFIISHSKIKPMHCAALSLFKIAIFFSSTAVLRFKKNVHDNAQNFLNSFTEAKQHGKNDIIMTEKKMFSRTFCSWT